MWESLAPWQRPSTHNTARHEKPNSATWGREPFLLGGRVGQFEIFPVLRQTIKPTLPAGTLLPVLQKGGRTSRSHNHSRQTSATTQGGARVPLDNRTHWPGQVALEPPLPYFRGLWRVGKSKMGCGRTTVRHHTSPTTTWNKSHKATLHFCPHDTLALRARLLQHDTQRQRRTTQHSTRRVVSTLRSHLDARTRAPRVGSCLKPTSAAHRQTD